MRIIPIVKDGHVEICEALSKQTIDNATFIDGQMSSSIDNTMVFNLRVIVTPTDMKYLDFSKIKDNEVKLKLQRIKLINI